MDRLRKDPGEIFRASKDAQDMSDYVLGRSWERNHAAVERDGARQELPRGLPERFRKALAAPVPEMVPRASADPSVIADAGRDRQPERRCLR